MLSPDQSLELMKTRRSVRKFQEHPVPREVLERVLQAAAASPSATNRQPWKFAVVSQAELRAQIVSTVRQAIDEVGTFIQNSRHGTETGGYLNYFHGPLAEAPVIVAAFYREHPDLLAHLIETGGGDPSKFVTMQQMQPELSAASGAVMSLLLQAHAEGLGGCWMSGPLLARAQIGKLVGITAPWLMFAAVALGYPSEAALATPRKPLPELVRWFD